MWAAVEAQAWDVVVTSPRQRCAAFARELSDKHHLPCYPDERFSELDFGLWEGRTLDNLAQESPQDLENFWRNPWRYPPPAGESMDSFSTRIRAGYGSLQQRFPKSTVLLVTHGGVIRLFHHLLTGSPRGNLLDFSVPHGSLHPLNDWTIRESIPS